MIDRNAMKHEAREIIGHAKVNAYVFTLIFLGLERVINVIDAYVSDDISAMLNYFSLETPRILVHHAFPGLVVTFVTVITFLLTIILNAGYTCYHLGIRRNQEKPFSCLFDGFEFVGKLVILNILQRVIIGLLTFLFIFPGLIFAYRYSFAIYNLCEDPSIGVIEALRRSAEQTQGYKWSLFVLDLSFIGLYFLSFFTLGLLNIWLTPYVEQTKIGYYFALNNRYTQIPTSNDDEDFHF